MMNDSRFKMKEEHRKTLEKSINEVLFQNGLEGLDKVREFRRTVPYANDQFTSFCWAIWRMATDQDFRSELYTYLNDKHVETALKRILEAYKDIK